MLNMETPGNVKNWHGYTDIKNKSNSHWILSTRYSFSFSHGCNFLQDCLAPAYFPHLFLLLPMSLRAYLFGIPSIPQCLLLTLYHLPEIQLPLLHTYLSPIHPMDYKKLLFLFICWCDLAAAATKSLQSYPTLCDPIDSAHQAPPSLGFSRQEHWSGLPFPSPMHESKKWKWSRSVVSDSLRPHGLQPTRLLRPWDPPGKSYGIPTRT